MGGFSFVWKRSKAQEMSEGARSPVPSRSAVKSFHSAQSGGSESPRSMSPEILGPKFKEIEPDDPGSKTVQLRLF